MAWRSHAVELWRGPTWGPFLKFLLVGGIGFAIDATLLTAIMHATNCPPWQARIPSFLVAVTATWLLNRSLAFAGRGLRRRSMEAFLYGTIQVCGAVLNFTVFTLCLRYFPLMIEAPAVPLAIGSAAGLAFNFSLSNTVLYSRSSIATAARKEIP